MTDLRDNIPRSWTTRREVSRSLEEAEEMARRTLLLSAERSSRCAAWSLSTRSGIVRTKPPDTGRSSDPGLGSTANSKVAI